MKKIAANILIVLILLLHLLRFNLWIINMSTSISLFDLLGAICWILVAILLLLNQRSVFLDSLYILLALGGINNTYNELLQTATNYDSNNYTFLFIEIIFVIIYNIILRKRVKYNK